MEANHGSLLASAQLRRGKATVAAMSTEKKTAQPIQQQTPVLLQHQEFKWLYPYPPPGVLEHYKRVSPEILTRLMDLTEAQVRSNMRNEEKKTDDAFISHREDAKAFLLGKWIGLIGTLAGFILIGCALWMDHPVVASGIGLAELGTIVWLLSRERGEHKTR